MNKTALVITKPLQLLISLAIVREKECFTEFDLLVVDDFFGAEGICMALQGSSNLPKNYNFEYCRNHNTAFRRILTEDYRVIYIDSDVGFKKYLQLLFLKMRKEIKICVYEEGLGTYRSNLYSSFGKMILNLFGVGTYFGGCIFTSEVYVYDRQCYEKIADGKNVVKSIAIEISDVLDIYRKLIDEVFAMQSCKAYGSAFANKECIVYLSSWIIDYSILNALTSTSAPVYIKLHPNIKIIPPELRFFKYCVIENSTPAEILLSYLSRVYTDVVVFHHGSSVVRYININNINYRAIESRQ